MRHLVSLVLVFVLVVVHLIVMPCRVFAQQVVIVPICTGVASADTAKFEAIKTSVGTTNLAVIQLPWKADPTKRCSTNTLTLTSNFTLDASAGGSISTVAGQTLTINSQIVGAKDKQIFYGTGTVSVTSQTLQAAWFPGADKGLKINAANTACGWNNCRIEAYGGGSVSQIIVGKTDAAKVAASKTQDTARRDLYLGPGDWQLTTVNGIRFNSYTNLRFAGQNVTRILECSSCTPGSEQEFSMMIAEAQSASFGNGSTYSHVNFSDFDLIGTRADFGSAAQAIAIGNGHHVRVTNIGLYSTNAEGVGVGARASSGPTGANSDAFSLGRYAEDVWITDCTFDHVASQAVGAVNFEILHVNRNHFINNGQTGGPSSVPIDVETNEPDDRANFFDGSSNIINNRDVQGTTNGIAYNPCAGGTTNYHSATIIGNQIYGTTLGSPSFSSNGIAVSCANGAVVSDNYIERMSQIGLYLSGTDIKADNNDIVDSGTGGASSVELHDFTHSTLSNTKVRNPNVGLAAILESGTNVQNFIYHNTAWNLTLSAGTSQSVYEDNFMVNQDSNANNFITDNAASTNNTFKGNTTRLTQLILASATSTVQSHCYFDGLATTTCVSAPLNPAVTGQALGGTSARWAGTFTTGTFNGQITSTLATGTAPLVIASTTNVPNLNASTLSGATFASPGTIGGTTPGQATFTTTILGPTAGATGEQRYLEIAANGTNYLGFKAPTSVTTNRIWTLPDGDGTNGQIMQTNGSGVLSWTANSATGMTNPMTTTGDVIFASNTAAPSTPARLAIGTAGQCLIVAAGLPSWGACSGSTSAAGSDTQVQINMAGSLGADAGFIWNNTTKAVTLSTATVGVQTPLLIRNTNNGNASTTSFHIGNDAATDTLALRVYSSTFTGTGNGSLASITNRQNAGLAFGANNAEGFRLTPGLFVGIGTTVPLTKLEVVDTISTSPRGILSSQYSTDTVGARIGFSKARGSLASPSTIVTGDTLGRFVFSGYDGSSFLEMGSITTQADAIVAATRIPTSMIFSTATNAAPSVLTERMRLNYDGFLGIGTTSFNYGSPLEIAHSGYTSAVVRSTDGSGAIALLAANAATEVRVGAISNHPVSFYVNNAEVGRFSTAGNFGVNQTSPTAKVDVGGNVNISSGSAYTYNSANVIIAQTALTNYYFGGAGNLTGSGNFNTATGFESLLSNTTGVDNSTYGYKAGRSNTTGNYNSFFGWAAGFSNTIGAYNVCVGLQACYSNVDGTEDVAIGYQALFANTGISGGGFGRKNTAVGYVSMHSNTVGDHNDAFGSDSLYANTTGTRNVAIGNHSLIVNTTGSFNHGFGVYSLGNTSTGSNNTGAGYFSGLANTTGSNNTFIGYAAGDSDGSVTTSANLSNATAIGYFAQVTQSNSLILGGTGAFAVSVGIGITAPAAALDVNGLMITRNGFQFVSATRPTCNAGIRGTIWYVAGGIGVSDTYAICGKKSDDSYVWTAIVTIP